MDDGRVTDVTAVDDLTSSTVVVTGTSAAVDTLLSRVTCEVLREDTAVGSRRVVVDAGRGTTDIVRAADLLEVRVRSAELEETVIVRGSRDE